MKSIKQNTLQMQPIVIGCWQLSSGHSDRFGRSAIYAGLSRYVEHGFTTLDCGDIYTGVEEILGDFRKESRCAFQVNTKFVPDLSALPTMSPDYIENIVHRSLSRLQTNQLDLVQFHWWDFAIPGYVEAAQHLAKMQQAGKIIDIGLTNFDTAHMAEIIEAGVPVVSNQVQYSLIDQRPEMAMLDYATAHDIDLLCYGTLAGGLLSEEWLGVSAHNYQEKTRSHTKYHLLIEDIGGWDVFQSLLRHLHAIARKHNVTIAVVANAFILQQSNCLSIVGFSYQDRITALKKMIGCKLDAEDVTTIANVLETFTPLTGDVYELERDRNGRHGRIMKYNLNKS